MPLAEVLAAALALPAEERAELVRGLTLKAVPSPDPLPIGVPIYGRGKGKVLYMAPDFDDPIEDLQEYMT